MINTKNISLSELLRDFNAGMGKYAGEDCPPGMVCDPAAAPAGKEALCPDCMSNPCICEEPEGEGSDPDDMVQAAVQAKAKQDEAVDAAKELRDMADAYIEDHDKAIAKEAEVFGELFAKSACEAMQRYSEPVQVNNNNSMPADYPIFKQACDTAYAYTMNKLAEGELPAADDSADEEDEADLAEAVRDAAAAARALAEHKAKKAKDKEKEKASDDERAEAAQGAYDEAMAQMHPTPATPDEQAAAAQGAYNETMAQMQPAPAPADAQAAASQNAYDQAMAQMQAQQDPQAAAAQNGYNQAMAQMQPQQ